MLAGFIETASAFFIFFCRERGQGRVGRVEEGRWLVRVCEGRVGGGYVVESRLPLGSRRVMVSFPPILKAGPLPSYSRGYDDY